MGTIILKVITAPFIFIGHVFDAMIEARQMQADFEAKRYIREYQSKP